MIHTKEEERHSHWETPQVWWHWICPLWKWWWRGWWERRGGGRGQCWWWGIWSTRRILPLTDVPCGRTAVSEDAEQRPQLAWTLARDIRWVCTKMDLCRREIGIQSIFPEQLMLEKWGHEQFQFQFSHLIFTLFCTNKSCISFYFLKTLHTTPMSTFKTSRTADGCKMLHTTFQQAHTQKDGIWMCAHQ